MFWLRRGALTVGIALTLAGLGWAAYHMLYRHRPIAVLDISNPALGGGISGLSSYLTGGRVEIDFTLRRRSNCTWSVSGDQPTVGLPNVVSYPPAWQNFFAPAGHVHRSMPIPPNRVTGNDITCTAIHN